MADNKNILIQEFKAIQSEFTDVLKRFPVDKVDKKLFGEWNLKDVIAHFVGWNEEFTSTVHDFSKGYTHTYWGKIYEFNNKIVSASKNKSWQEILNEFKNSGNEFIEIYIDYPVGLLNTKIWKDKIYTPIRIIEINIHHYQKAQLIQINKLLEKWKL